MAKVKITRKQQKPQYINLALEKINFILIGTGIIFIVLGYIFMSEKSVSGFLPTTLAPILLVLGYCVIIPVGILYKKKSASVKAETEKSKTIVTEKQSNIKITSNIKTK